MILSRKVKSLTAAALVVFLLAGCAGNTTTPPAETPPPSTASSSSVAESSSAPEPTEAPQEEVVVDIWSWESDEHQAPVISEFNKAYPNITIRTTLTESTDMPVKVQTALASGSEMPDICWLEMGVRGKLLALDCWEDLTAEPYNLDTSLLWESMLPLATNDRGELVGLDGGPSMSGIAYKRDLAQEYFGVSTPEEMEILFTSWDVFIEKGNEVKEKSGGTVFLFPGLTDVMQIVKGQSNIPFLVDGTTLNLNESVGSMFDLLIQFKSLGIVDGIEQGTPAWNASVAEAKHIFLPMPDWGPTWLIKVNDPDVNNTWGLMTPPGGGFPWGGTCWSIPKGAKDKEAAFTFMSWCKLTEDGATARRDGLGIIAPLKSLYAEEANFYVQPDEVFAGQDVLKHFTSKIAPSVQATRQVCEFDSEIQDAMNLAMTALNGSNGTMTKEELIKIMEDDILQKVPDLKTK